MVLIISWKSPFDWSRNNGVISKFVHIYIRRKIKIDAIPLPFQIPRRKYTSQWICLAGSKGYYEAEQESNIGFEWHSRETNQAEWKLFIDTLHNVYFNNLTWFVVASHCRGSSECEKICLNVFTALPRQPLPFVYICTVWRRVQIVYKKEQTWFLTLSLT
jgi:hypothetical protein